MTSKIIRDTGGGCSICGQKMTPPVNVEGTYWLCSECAVEKLWEADKREAVLLSLLREAREALRLAGRALGNADIPWPFDDVLLSRIDAALEEAEK